MSRRGRRQTSGGTRATARAPRDWSEVCFVLVLLVLALAVYAPALHGAALWDDDENLTRPDLQPLAGLARIWFKLGATQQYYPVDYSAFWLLHRVFGDATFPYHFITVCLHVTAAWLALRVLRRLHIPGAFLAAAIFALHPIQVESVAWITEIKNTLSAVFYFSAALAYLRFDETRTRRPYAVASILFVLGVLTKTHTATLPAALLLVFWWQRGHLSWRRDWLPLLPWCAFGAAAGSLTAFVERTFVGARGPAYALTLLDRTLIAGRAVWFYAATLAWPSSLSFMYPRWGVNRSDPRAYVPLAAVAIVIAACWALRHRTRAPLAVALFFVGTLFPALTFANVYWFRYAFVADHFQYLAGLGLIVGFSAAAVRALSGWRRAPDWAPAALVVAIATPLALTSYRQSSAYADNEALFRMTIERNPSCAMAYLNLAYLYRDGDAQHATLAEKYLRTALRLEPNSGDAPKAHNSLGGILLRERRPAEAVAEFRAAVSLSPSDARHHFNLAQALTENGDGDTAAREYARAAELDPDLAEAQQGLGAWLFTHDRVREAVPHFERVAQLQPRSAEALNNLGGALAGAGRVQEAASYFQRALSIDPGYAPARDNLARLDQR